MGHWVLKAHNLGLEMKNGTIRAVFLKGKVCLKVALGKMNGTIGPKGPRFQGPSVLVGRRALQARPLNWSCRSYPLKIHNQNNKTSPGSLRSVCANRANPSGR